MWRQSQATASLGPTSLFARDLPGVWPASTSISRGRCIEVPHVLQRGHRLRAPEDLGAAKEGEKVVKGSYAFDLGLQALPEARIGTRSAQPILALRRRPRNCVSYPYSCKGRSGFREAERAAMSVVCG